MRYSQPLVLVLALCSLVGCSEKEPTVEEFIAEFTAAAQEYERVSFLLNEQPLPVRTGDRATYLQNMSAMFRSDAASFAPVIDQFENMNAPSDPPEAEQLRAKFLETILLVRDDMLESANALDAGQRPTETTQQLASKIVVNMDEIADLADKIGMDSTEFRRYREEIQTDFVE